MTVVCCGQARPRPAILAHHSHHTGSSKLASKLAGLRGALLLGLKTCDSSPSLPPHGFFKVGGPPRGTPPWLQTLRNRLACRRQIRLKTWTDVLR